MNNSYSRTVQWSVWGLLFLTVISIGAAFLWTRLRPEPVVLPIYAPVTDFKLTNQLGQTISLADLKGRVWVADVIFTRCAGPCASMTRQMRQIQRGLPPRSSVPLISLTADPQFDTPEVLKRYAERFEADHENWHFLTGDKKPLYDFAIQGLKFTVIENDVSEPTPEEDLFIHSTKFVVIDREARIRGYFDGAQAGAAEEVLRAVQALLRER